MDARRAWRQELLRLAGWIALGALVGAIFGRVALFVLAAVCVYLARQMLSAYRLHRWLASERNRPADGAGVWQHVYAELHRLKQRNRRRKRRLKAIVNEFQASTAALPDGAIVIDGEGRIVWFNDAAAALLALRSPQDMGQRVANLIRHPQFADYLAQRTDSGGLEIPSPVNETDLLLLRLIPYGNNQRLLICRDISEDKRLEHTRRDFVANASHELRTPLTVLRGYLEMMAEETQPQSGLAEWRAPIAEMGDQARRMNEIIDSLLKLARIEADGLQERQEAVDVPAMVDALVDELGRGNSQRAAITRELSRDLSLYGRPSELQSVFSNLLSNAVRYTPADGAIHVRWFGDDSGVCFAVTDTGPGIDAAHLPRLTERFYRADAGRDAKSGGTGLGLAIVKHCLEHHEAELHIDSTPGAGSTFTCRFPAQRRVTRRAA